MSEPDIHVLLPPAFARNLQAAAVPRSLPILLLLQRICSKREHDATESLGFSRHTPAMSSKNSAVEHGKPLHQRHRPGCGNKQATFKRLFSNFSPARSASARQLLEKEGADEPRQRTSGVDVIGG